jgi:integrase
MAAIRGDEIRVKTRKRGVHVALPVHPILSAAIAARGSADALTICVNSDGKPWTQSGFNSTWQKFRNRLEAEGKIAPGLTLHGGRHTFIGMLDEMAVPQDIRMKLAGHQSPAQNAEYSKNAPIPEQTRGIIRKLKI